MKSPMLPEEHQRCVQRALELGRSGKPDALSELIELSDMPSHEVQRLSASAIGKLAEFGAHAQTAVERLAELALKGAHPQTRQYAIRALQKYGPAGAAHVHDLRDMARNPSNKPYVRAAASKAAGIIEQAAKDTQEGVRHRCQRCHVPLTPDEWRRSQETFQRSFCDRCYDETFLTRRNFEMQVEIEKTVEARDGTLVQSVGERKIAEWLTAKKLDYRYDSKYRIINEFQIRPDFYLPEVDVYIEFWGLNTPQYKMSMYKKQQLYQQQGKKLISVYPEHLSSLDDYLQSKLRLFGLKF